MKYYLHQATSVRTEKRKYKLENYQIKEFSTFKECLEFFKRNFYIEGEDEIVKEYDGYYNIRLCHNKQLINSHFYRGALKLPYKFELSKIVKPYRLLFFLLLLKQYL